MSHWYPVYLNKAYREKNTPHVLYTCDYTSCYWLPLDDSLQDQTLEAKRFAFEHNRNDLDDAMDATRIVGDYKHIAAGIGIDAIIRRHQWLQHLRQL